MIVTARLALEPLVRAHANELFALLSDPEIYRYLDEKPPASLDALAQRYARLESRRSPDGREHWLNWAVREIASGSAAGYVQATVSADRALIAYVIAPPMQGHGFGREATQALMNELASSYGVRTFRAGIDSRNAASIALVRRLGFVPAGDPGNGDVFFEKVTGGKS